MWKQYASVICIIVMCIYNVYLSFKMFLREARPGHACLKIKIKKNNTLVDVFFSVFFIIVL